MAENILKNESQSPFEIILNNLDSSIYISDMESYEILFVNDHMKKLFKKDLKGGICWKSFHEGLEGPCEFCTNDKLLDAAGYATGPCIWEFYNQKLQEWYELHDQAILWPDGRLVRLEVATNITGKKLAELALKESHELLEEKINERTLELKEMNSALKVLLRKRDEDVKSINKQILSNVSSLIIPYLRKLAKTQLNYDQQTLLKIVQANVAEIISPISHRFASSTFGLTLTEIKVANLIKEGAKTKEIARILILSPRTIDKYRENIRSKLSIQNKKVNLQSYLASMQ